ncbi:proteophosphoglycan 5 [Actinosynnema sp. CA-248983]
MALVEVELPDPLRLRGRWAAFAAVCAARGWGGSCHAEGPVWHFDDGGGNWADLHHLGGGRAVLLGHDHEYSETYYANAAEYFEEETDLLAGAPDWWSPPVRAVVDGGAWVGFVYGFEDGRWLRAPYELDDGFDSVGLPALDDERCREVIAEFTRDAPSRPAAPAIDALIAAGGDVTEAHVAAVVGTGWDVAAGVAAARRFREV